MLVGTRNKTAAAVKVLKRQDGFSLIETMAAIIILTAALIPIMSALVNAHQLVFQGRDLLVANNLVAQTAEQVKTIPFADIVSDSDVDPGSGFVIQKTVSGVPDTAGKLKRVNLEILDGSRVMARGALVVFEEGL